MIDRAARRIVAGLVLTTASTAFAQVTNGSFETGNLSGWYSSGTTAMATGLAGFPAIAGSASALVVAMSFAPVPPYSCAVDIWNINCPQPLPFAASGAALPTYSTYAGAGVGQLFFRGGFIGQNVAVNSGDKLLWSAKAYGEANTVPPVAPSGDGGRFYATNGSVESFVDVFDGNGSFTFPQSGQWSIYFGVFQREDNTIWSALTFDSIRVQAVPEPASALLLSAALLAGAACRRRLQLQLQA